MRQLLFATILSCAACATAAKPVHIPLREGLTQVIADDRPAGDAEHILTLSGASTAFVDFAVEFPGPPTDPTATVTWTRRVRREDLAKSNRLNVVFQDGDSPAFPGSTLVHLSSATLAELKRTGKVAMVFGHAPEPANKASILGFALVPSGRKYYRGILHRVSGKPSTLNVVVNGKRMALPVVHASGTFTVAGASVDLALSVLDDLAHPLILALKYGGNSGSTVRIDFPVAKPKADLLAAALSDGACRAELNGIYFDFAKATLLPQSQPALRAVAEMMRSHSTWRLHIEGHTDNVGTAAFNQNLSKRRSSAVLAALTSEHKVSPERLTAAGWGFSRPVASNDTLQGRAANRRVELSRTCP